MANLNTMKKAQSKYTVLLVLLFIIVSCSTQKLDLKRLELNSKSHAINVIIRDYYNSSPKYINKYNVFEIQKEQLSDDYYVFSVYPRINYLRVNKELIVGSYPEKFPTNFKINKKKLFLWNDPEKALGNELLQKMDEYEILDSIDYRHEVGIYYYDWESNRMIGLERRPMIIDEGIYSTYYVICKNDIKKFKKKKSTGISSIKELRLPKCD